MIRVPLIAVDGFLGAAIGVLTAHLLILGIEWAFSVPQPSYVEFLKACVTDYKLEFCNVIWAADNP